MAEDTPIRFIRLPEVLRITGISRSLVYKLQAEGKFPRGVKLGAISVAWVESEVQAWCAQRIAERDASAVSRL